jgi:serine/threonine-protein kinase
VVFRSATAGIYRKDASGAGTEQRITDSANLQIPTDWSRDGRLLLFYEVAPETQRDVWVLPMTADGKPEAGAKPRPYLRTRFNETQARFSPEPHPRWVAYQSDESGQDEVYIQAFPEPRGKWPISTGGGRYPRWGPDGRELYYVAPDDKLMAVCLKVGVDTVETSEPRALFTVPWDAAVVFSPYDVAPDGQRFLVRAVPETGSQPLQVIVNWPALVKQKAAAQ